MFHNSTVTFLLLQNNPLLFITAFNLLRTIDQTEVEKYINQYALDKDADTRVIIEKYRKTTQFIMITEKINTIINPIRSRCLCIRIPNMNMKQKRELSKTYLKDKSYEERIPIYDKIYSLEDENEIIQFSKRNK